MDGTPLITMVKSRVLSECPELDDGGLQLDRTLGMLCSFLSVDDFVSFLTSPSFAGYARSAEPWVVFEIGLYTDHTKTLEFIASADTNRFVDPGMTGVFADHVAVCQTGDDMKQALGLWLAHVTLQ